VNITCNSFGDFINSSSKITLGFGESSLNNFVSKVLSEYHLEDGNHLVEILISILLKKKILLPFDFIDC
jgi:hypothetical protein